MGYGEWKFGWGEEEGKRIWGWRTVDDVEVLGGGEGVERGGRRMGVRDWGVRGGVGIEDLEARLRIGDRGLGGGEIEGG